MEERIRARRDELIADAEHAAYEGAWASVRALAGAVLSLVPGDPEARRLLQAADKATAGDGERRQLTVMFCDVVGSTSLSQHHDPEVVRDVLRAYRRVLDEVVARAEAHIALWIGDGALVYFGHPTPHEDEAWRAVHTGLALLAELDPVVRDAWTTHRLDLAVRVAIHTGLVIRAEMGTPSAPDHDAIVGATPNLAARLQDKARPGTLIISEETHDLVRGRFAVVPVGPFRVKGFRDPVGAFEVEFEVAPHSPVEAVGERGPFVGRAAELASLIERWSLVQGGGSEAVLVTGDSGIGKSRLAAELRQHALEHDGRVLECGCSSFHSTTPLHPVRRLVERAAGIDPRRPQDRLARLESALDAVGLGESVATIASQLGFVDDTDEPAIDPAHQRDLALGALATWVEKVAAGQPLLVVVDDFQWIDPTSRDLIASIVARRPPRLLLLLLARAGTRSLWSEATVPVLPLAALPDRDALRLADGLAGGRLDPAALTNLVDRCDGIPLYLEELVRSALVDTSATLSASRAVPSSLRDPLLARLAAAGGDFVLPQLVATLGDGAPLELLRAVGGWSEADLETRLEAPIAAGILLRDGDRVRFRHHLLAEMAYDTQLHRIRQQRHATAALILAAAPVDAVADSNALAHHLERAGQPGPAIDHLVRAARGAQRKGAHSEALQQLEHALGLLGQVADDTMRLGYELVVREARHFSWAATLSTGTPAAISDFERCIALLHELPPRPEHDPAFVSVFSHLIMTSRITEADELNHAGRTRFAEHGVDAVAMPVDAGSCLTAFFVGDLRSAIEHGQAFLASPSGRLDVAVPEGYPLPNELVGTVASTVAAALVLAGDVDAGRALFGVAQARSGTLAFPHGPYTLAWIKSLAAMAWFNIDDEVEYKRAVADIRQLTIAHGMDNYALLSNIQDAMASIHFHGNADAAHLDTLLSVWRITGADTWLPCMCQVSVEGHRLAGDHALALATAKEWLAHGERTGVRYWEVPLLRLHGELRLEQGDEDGVDDLLRAAAMASDRGARVFELEARTSLARHTGEAPALKELASIVRWFPEHLHFPALDDARRLVEGIAGQD